MKIDNTRAIMVYVTAWLVLGGAFYGLVLYPLVLDPLVQGALIAAGTAAYQFVFGAEIAKQATRAALAQPAPSSTISTSSGDGTTVTTTSVEP